VKVVGLAGVPVPAMVRAGTVLLSVSKNWPLLFTLITFPFRSEPEDGTVDREVAGYIIKPLGFVTV